MKVRLFPGPRVLSSAVAQGRGLLANFGRQCRRSAGVALVMAALAGLLFFILFPRDAALLADLHFLRGREEQSAQQAAAFLSRWGDYLTYNVPLALAIWGYGVWKRDRAWRRVALVAFLGATLAGLFDDCFRFTLGRPRPSAHLPDGFYGLPSAWRGGYQSFPSGHSASVFGAAVSLLVVCRALGIAATLYALAVAWARLELNRHFPSDVAVGSLIGIYFGAMMGKGAWARNNSTQVAR